jgi:hypothetical protein
VLWNVLVALTQLANTLIGGWPDETTSSRAHRQQERLRWRVVRRAINAAFFWQADHCESAWLAERARRQSPPELR